MKLDKQNNELGMNTMDESTAYLNIEAIPFPICLMDVTGKMTAFNHSAEKLCGFSQQEVLGKTLVDLFKPVDENYNENKVLQQLLNKQGVSSEFIYNSNEGKPRYMLVTQALFMNDRNEALGIIGNFTSLDNEIKSENVPASVEESYLGILGNIKEAIYVQDKTGIFLFVNKAASAFYGYSQEELLGNTPLMLSAGERNDFKEINRKILKCCGGEAQTLEFWGLKKTGEIIPTEVSLTPGSLFGQKVVIAMVRDITERKLAETAIRQGELKYKMLLDNAFDAIYLTKGRQFQYVNKRFTEITGLTMEDVTAVAFDFANTITDKSLAVLGEGAQKPGNGEPHNPTYLFQVKDKKNEIHDVEVSTVIIESGDESSVLGIMRDVTVQLATNRELEWEKTYFENIYSSVPYGIVLLDEDDRVIDANSAFIEMFQWTLTELTGNPINDFIVPENLKAEGKKYTKDVVTGEKVDTETVRQRKDGSLMHVKIIGKPAQLPDGNQLVFGIYQDISERISFVHEIEKQKNYYEELVQRIPYGIALIDKDNYIKDCNEWFANLFGYQKSELIHGEKIHKIIPIDLQTESNELRVRVMAGERVYKESTRLMKDGQLVDVAITAQLLERPDGNQYLIAVYQNITDRKTVERELQFERNLMVALMANIPDTIYFKDTKSRFLRINQSQAKALGVEKPEDAIGKTDLDFFDNEHSIKSFDDERKIFFEGDRLVNAQEHIKTANGWRWFTASKVPMYDNLGKIIGLAGVSRDITDIKNLESALLERETHLKQLNAEKDKLFSIIAHDLRSPFNSFLMLTEMLMDDSLPLNAEEAKKLTASMYKSAFNLYDLLENLLSWSLLQRGITVIDLSTTQLLDIVNACVENFAASITSKMLSLTVSIPDDLAVIADQNLLGSIMRNLLSNAIKFTPAHGSVTISTRELNDNEVLVSMTDTGIGMNQELRKKLFSIEIKGRKGTEGEPSSGLGLILVKDFIEKHGGHLYVDSEENKGSTFSFNLKKA
jgi:PAS domain S-box-containing protein